MKLLLPLLLGPIRIVRGRIRTQGVRLKPLKFCQRTVKSLVWPNRSEAGGAIKNLYHVRIDGTFRLEPAVLYAIRSFRRQEFPQGQRESN